MGGVENAGNTCIISVLLQEFAALPNFYDMFLNAQLEQDVGESESDFRHRQALQTHLSQCVNQLRTGITVNKRDICQLSKLLVQLGWQRDTTSHLRRILHEWVPGLFPLPISDPYVLYEKILLLFPEVSSASHEIRLLTRISTAAHQQLFEQSQHSLSPDHAPHILWRVNEQNFNGEIALEENLQIDERTYSLKIVHVVLQRPTGNHVIVYRKENNHWICCDDVRVYRVDALPSTNIYAVIYDSRITPASL
jgi:ubiquitin C-terminal hydrolase